MGLIRERAYVEKYFPVIIPNKATVQASFS